MIGPLGMHRQVRYILLTHWLTRQPLVDWLLESNLPLGLIHLFNFVMLECIFNSIFNSISSQIFNSNHTSTMINTLAVSCPCLSHLTPIEGVNHCVLSVFYFKHRKRTQNRADFCTNSLIR